MYICVAKRGENKGKYDNNSRKKTIVIIQNSTKLQNDNRST